MKLCNNCGQLVAEEVIVCPSCGSDVGEGRKKIDDYLILSVLHEGYSSVLCKAIQDDSDHPVMIRIFTSPSGVDDSIAQRLRSELEKLKELPEDYFVRHLEIKKSSDGLWYRVSEWIEAENWGTLLASGRISDFKTIVGLFFRITSILEGLHQIGHVIPHLILDDIIVFRNKLDRFEIKIDFKLSRFLDPALDRPGPMLKRLLSSHPDIINDRPLDIRSDIWSLGKVFVEILTADYDTSDHNKKIDGLLLPDEFKALLKTMLADDPDLRPRSMKDVALVLLEFKNSKGELTWKHDDSNLRTSEHHIKGIKIWISTLIIVTILLLLGALTWLYFSTQKADSEAIFEKFITRYAASVAFVVTEYWLNDNATVIYHNWTEGTAFLVDDLGHLMTNRHVACPWLEDAQVNAVIAQYEFLNRSIEFNYRIFLWFEGDRAFKRLPTVSRVSDPSDIYYLESAFSTKGTSSLAIAGVARLPVKTWQVVKFPLRDDFAILKIENVPPDLFPLPMDVDLKTHKIKRLSPVIALGFPLGSKTQESTVNVSVTRGHVRRTFENLFQVDTSIYQGNSGGPIIDRRGKVIGIASKVAVEMAAAPLPVATRLSDIGMVLPISKAAVFMEEIRNGEEKWDGILDLSVDEKIERIKRLARDRKLEEAGMLVKKELSSSRDPDLILAAGMISLCLEDYPEARSYFKRALTMDKQNHFIRFMLYLVNCLQGQPIKSPDGELLRSLDWRSPFEFYGLLARMIKNTGWSSSGNWYSTSEASWFHCISGLDAEKKEDWAASEGSFKKALLNSDPNGWVYYLSLAGLERIESLKLKQLKSEEDRARYKKTCNAFSQHLEEKEEENEIRRAKVTPIVAKLVRPSIGIEEKIEILEKWFSLDPDNRGLLVWLAYYCAAAERWDKALGYINEYRRTNGWENAGRLKLGLLESGIFHLRGSKEEASKSLAWLAGSIQDPWYGKIIQCLQGKLAEHLIIEECGDSSQYLLVTHTALGFWSEGSGNREQALKHYEASLGSYLDEWAEYEFAMMRIQHLKIALHPAK